MNFKKSQPPPSHRISLAITGASGVRYGIRMLEVLVDSGHRVELMMTANAGKCLQLEEGLPAHPKEWLAQLGIDASHLVLHDVNDLASVLASGSGLRDLYAGFIVPCSMGTLSRIAWGNSGNLIERHADVLIKEKKPLVFIPRETPLSEIHLENLLRLTRLGCHCVPAMPGFYHEPKTIHDLVDHVVGKALDVAHLEHHLYKRWRESEK